MSKPTQLNTCGVCFASAFLFRRSFVVNGMISQIAYVNTRDMSYLSCESSGRYLGLRL